MTDYSEILKKLKILVLFILIMIAGCSSGSAIITVEEICQDELQVMTDTVAVRHITCTGDTIIYWKR